jgi:heme/copper-type cytochrome/quinol oxidase subunit 2
MTPEPLNTILIVLILSALALFALAWMALLAGVVVFIVYAVGYRRLRDRGGSSAENEAAAETAVRRGMWGLAACAVIVVCYVVRSWAGTYYYDDIAQGLVLYSRAWWIVGSLTVLWWASIPVGMAGAITAFISGLRLRGLARMGGPAIAATD